MHKSQIFRYTGCWIPFAPLCNLYMQKSHEHNKDIFLNYIQFYMKKSIYFDAICFHLLLQRNFQKFVVLKRCFFGKFCQFVKLLLFSSKNSKNKIKKFPYRTKSSLLDQSIRSKPVFWKDMSTFLIFL